MKYFFLLLPFFCFSQQWKQVDFKKLEADIYPDFETKSLKGTAGYEFEVRSPIDTIRIDAINMTFTKVIINGKTVNFKNNGKALLLFDGFKKGKNFVWIDYSATPQQTMYFTGPADNYQIWTQGQGKYTSHWLPSFDDTNEKVIFSISVRAEKGYSAISNGIFKGTNDRITPTLWAFEMEKPMSSYLVMLAIGKFSRTTQMSASGIPLQMYYQTGEDAKFAPTYIYSKEIFDFLETEIGVKYPWKIYKQIPVKDFLYAGMENTTATVFAQDFMVDKIGYNDKSYVNVNAHELAHQWFGDMVTAKSGKHHWLQEGFATYYALLAEESLFGADHFNFQLYEMAEELQRAAATDTMPILNERASSLTFYRKGAWALHVLREGVGHGNFRKAVKSYLEKYGFKNVETSDFLAEINKVSDYDTASFQKKWLEQSGFEVNEAIALLRKNKAMELYFEVLGLQGQPIGEKMERFSTLLKQDIFIPIKEEIIFQTASVPFAEKEALLKLALQTNDIKVRQAVAGTAGKIPASFYAEYESMLDDASYITKGLVLKNLWSDFPDRQHELLEKTKNNTGLNDKNLRIQWLTLALGTRDYQRDNKLKFYEELLDYGTPKYESSIRQNAIGNLLFFSPNDTNALAQLVNPLVHHKWQFSKFAREKIREKIKRENYRDFFTKLLPQLPENESVQLKRLLDEK